MILASCQLESEDYLNYQLFVASKSKNIKKKRRFIRILWPVLHLIIALSFFYWDQTAIAIYLLIMSIVWLVFYPKWDRIHYINHYKKFIKENYTSLSEKAVVEFHPEFIFLSDSKSEGKVNWMKFKEIIETEDNSFLRLDNAQSIVLPKKKLSNWGEIKTFLQSKSAEMGISYTPELDWKWK
jgi:c-di-AMP phosphodiesterase-like protein